MADTYNTLREMFYANYEIKVTKAQAKSLVSFVREYELRKDHPNALNTPYIGLNKMYFLPKDQNFVFDTFGVIKEDLKEKLHSCKNINPDFIVQSDPFNQFLIWTIHRLFKSDDLSDQETYQTQYELLKLLQYKFFTSTVNAYFKYGANEDYMQAAIERLSGKFDIKKKETGTWKLIMEKRAEEILDPDSIHYKTLKNYDDDDDILYVITDTQTRIRNKLKLITSSYYEVRKRGEKIQQYNIADEVDGEQLLKSIEAKYDRMSLGVARQALSVDRFVDVTKVKLVSGLIKNAPPDLIRKFLTKFTDIAAQHYKNGNARKQEEGENYPRYVGYAILIEQIIVATYGVVLKRKDVDVNSKLSILETTVNLYRASRINDEQVLAVKESVMSLVEEMDLTKRDETKGALRLAFITYIMVLSFDYM